MRHSSMRSVLILPLRRGRRLVERFTFCLGFHSTLVPFDPALPLSGLTLRLTSGLTPRLTPGLMFLDYRLDEFVSKISCRNHERPSQ